MNNPFSTLTKKEWLLWLCSLFIVLVSNILAANFDPLTLIAALVGVTSLVFAAKGNVWAQVVMIVFSILYGIISFRFRYWGEMITYLGMALPMAVWSAITWLRHPAESGDAVAIQKLNLRQFAGLLASCVAVTVLGFALGTLGMVDYYGMGVLTVFVFYFLRGREWWKLLGQIAALYWINVSHIGGQIFPIELFGLEFEVCEQGLALLSLVPIWLYRGRQGHHSKVFQYACYAFYPVHMLILGLIQLSL